MNKFGAFTDSSPPRQKRDVLLQSGTLVARLDLRQSSRVVTETEERFASTEALCTRLRNGLNQFRMGINGSLEYSFLNYFNSSKGVDTYEWNSTTSPLLTKQIELILSAAAEARWKKVVDDRMSFVLNGLLLGCKMEVISINDVLRETGMKLSKAEIVRLARSSTLTKEYPILAELAHCLVGHEVTASCQIVIDLKGLKGAIYEYPDDGVPWSDLVVLKHGSLI